MARSVHSTPGVTSFVSTAVAVTVALAQEPSVAVLPVDATEAELAAADVEALRTAASEGLGSAEVQVSTELPAVIGPEQAARADAAWLSRTFTPHGVSHWLVTRVRGRARTYEIELELWSVDADRPLVSVSESCAICGQRELRDLVRDEARELEDTLNVAPEQTTATRSLAPRVAPEDRASPPADHPDRDPSLRIGGYVTLTAGAVALIAGSTLIALDGREHSARCRSGEESVIDADGDCRYVHNTLAGGVSLVLGGVVASAGGITLLALDARRRHRAELSMRIGHRRITLVGRF